MKREKISDLRKRVKALEIALGKHTPAVELIVPALVAKGPMDIETLRQTISRARANTASALKRLLQAGVIVSGRPRWSRGRIIYGAVPDGVSKEDAERAIYFLPDPSSSDGPTNPERSQ